MAVELAVEAVVDPEDVAEAEAGEDLVAVASVTKIFPQFESI